MHKVCIIFPIISADRTNLTTRLLPWKTSRPTSSTGKILLGSPLVSRNAWALRLPNGTSPAGGRLGETQSLTFLSLFLRITRGHRTPKSSVQQGFLQPFSETSRVIWAEGHTHSYPVSFLIRQECITLSNLYLHKGLRDLRMKQKMDGEGMIEDIEGNRFR